MTRAGHYTSALAVASIGLAISPTFAGLATACGTIAAANLPDDLEMPIRFGKSGFAPTLIPHRSFTHWPWTYLALGVLASRFHWPFEAFLAGIACGALVHLAIDAISPHGIPWVNPLKALPPSYAVYRTWTSSEWRIIGPLVIGAGFALLLRHEQLTALVDALPTFVMNVALQLTTHAQTLFSQLHF